jgi:hypothetical protein
LKEANPRSPHLERDSRLLKEVLKVDKEELCRHYKS